ncbi:MAG TPA: hypothetical protein DIU00_13430 [Phycisphaerales bacterium]|nr:hypothetical protein [Phycisphaerales bacterium]
MRKSIFAGDSRSKERTIRRVQNLFHGMKNPLLWSLTALAFGFTSVRNLQADPIFNNSGPVDAFVNGHSWTLSYDHTIHHVGKDYTFPFAVSDDYLPGSISSAAGFGYNELDVWLLNEAGNTPGSVFASFHFTGTMSGPWSVIAGTSVLQPLLNSGEQYRLAASASDPPGTQANWCCSPIVDVELITGLVGMGSWYTFTNTWGRFPYPAP